MYKSSLRVYLIFSLLALSGVIAGLYLPISLYPNSSKPAVSVGVGLAGLSAKSFFDSYGLEFESKFRSIEKGGIEIEKVVSRYSSGGVNYDIFFEWGVSNEQALSEVENAVSSLKSSMPKEMADNVWVNQWDRNSGFFALSFFSSKRSVDEVYEITNALFDPLLSDIVDADNAGIWNPNKKELTINIDMEKMAQFGLLIKDLTPQITSSLVSFGGGTIRSANKSLKIKIDSDQDILEKIKNTIINTPGGAVYLTELADIIYDVSSNQARIFKTNGASSLVLFANPKGGGNVKKMSEDLIKLVKDNEHKLPEDIKHRILVDPSEFIRSSVNNVFHEVAIAAILAVLILFLFIGDFRNVVTSSIEIPLSMVVAFIFMKFTDVNLNLISLGGLALAAGMNVDASVVVLENILSKFKKITKNGTINLNSDQKFSVIKDAVGEVAIPVIVSMTTTLVVFIPIAMTSKLTNAVLGDLARAVIYSHCFSAVVALVLVPTIRYQIINRQKNTMTFPRAPLAGFLRKIDSYYDSTLHFILSRKKLIWSALVSVFVVLILLGSFIIPKLPKEIIGKPDSDWLFVWMKSSESTHIKQMEQIVSEVEDDVLTSMSEYFTYTFVQINRKDNGTVMFRLRNKSMSSEALTKLQEKLQNTPDTYFHVDLWNPASLPLPEERDLRLKVTGSDSSQNLIETDKLISDVREKKIYERIWSTPRSEREEIVQFYPYEQLWNTIVKENLGIRISDIIDITRVSSAEKNIGNIVVDDRKTNISLGFGKDGFASLEDLKSTPIKLNGKIIPLSALGEIKRAKERPEIYRENGETLVLVEASLDKSDKRDYKKLNIQVDELIQTKSQKLLDKNINMHLLDPKVELNDALKQLAIALFISLLLIMLALVMQFGNLISPLVVMLAIPLGMIGVFISLYIFNSTLSLNSTLGLILLNGIAVNNSILLVEFTNKIFESGKGALESVIEGSRKRLRPILITTITTILGMLPIALGMGEGGKILQPLGIAVSGGLWVSMLLTLLLIPSVQFLYLASLEKKRESIPSEDDLFFVDHFKEKKSENVEVFQ